MLGLHTDEFMNRFFLAMDKRLKAFMDAIDGKIMLKEIDLHESDIPKDFEFGVLRFKIFHIFQETIYEKN